MGGGKGISIGKKELWNLSFSLATVFPDQPQSVTHGKTCIFVFSDQLQTGTHGKSQGTKTLQLEGLEPSLAFVHSDQLQTTKHGKQCVPTTKNPYPPQIYAQFFILLYAYLAPIPNPIAINRLSSLRTTDLYTVTLGAARKKYFATHAISFVQYRSQKDIAKESTSENVHKEFDLNPKEITLNIGAEHPYPLELQQEFPLAQQITQLVVTKEIKQKTVQQKADSTVANASATHLPLLSQQNKVERVPIRRSHRLQAKLQAKLTMSKPPAKIKSRLCKIPFANDPHENPLDTSKALEVLQATGVVINKKIEDMIEEAVKRDQDAQVVDQPMPQTPLHDPIPPLNIPGTDIFL